MPKNVVVCCDGTANQFAIDKTNVIKLYMTLVQDPSAQVTYYHPGLGTMEPPGALTPLQRRVTQTLGLAFGYGLQGDLQAAYVFLMEAFEPGDRLFLFGFSRGAYTARALASLLHMFGLVRRGNQSLVPYLTRMAMAIHTSRPETASAVSHYFQLAQEFKATMSRSECKPWFVGVWDTVNSVGWVDNPLHLPYTTNNPDIEIGRHAVSLDERRAFFRDNLWRPSTDPAIPSGPKDLKQVWFPGVHCDVGGGYPEAESGLSKIALGWMLREAEAHGLLVDLRQVAVVMGAAPGSPYVPADANAMMHTSLTGWWWAAEYVPKKVYDYSTGRPHWHMNRGARRFVPPGSLVHVSAFDRGEEYKARLPADAVAVS